MKITKTFKYRIYPDEEQKMLLAKHFGSKRFVFNYFLNQRKIEYLENEKSLNYYDNAKALTELKKLDDFIWLKEINAQSLQSALRDLDTAYNRFFRKQAQFPKFKSKHDKQSFRVPQFVEYTSGALNIPKFKKTIRVKEDRPLEGEISFATISKTSTGKYFVSITCEVEHTLPPKETKQIGIDLGIKDLAICSDGVVIPNIKTTKKYEKVLAYQQRQLSKKKKGSKSRNKQKIKVAKIHEKISNTRSDYLHNITTKLVRENQTICIEDLAVVNMIKNPNLSKCIADASWGEFVRQLNYKSQWNGRNLTTIDRFFPSSRTCNKCKFIYQSLTLEEREWICPSCGERLDRDLNASQNILEQGLNIFSSGYGIESESKQKCEEALGLSKSMSHETQPSLVVG